MHLRTVNYINIAFIGLSMGLAWILPFELFLFSYAVLGPLHYLTEINWLKQRSFFTSGRNDYLWLVVCCLGYFGLTLLFDYDLVPDSRLSGHNLSGRLSEFLYYASYHFIFLAFAGSVAFAFLDKTWQKIILFAGLGLASPVLQNLETYLIVFGALLPTVIHVYIFTGAFMLAGALKAKDVTGTIAFMLFMAGGIICFLAPAGSVETTAYVKESFLSSGFQYVYSSIYALFSKAAIVPDQIFTAESGIRVQRFLAFAYTYHYLNWFSKTTVIQWHKINKRSMAGMALIWLFALALYLYNYKLGFQVLLFLSMLHVFLEFPLNFRSFGQIFSLGAGYLSGKKQEPL